MQQSTSCTSPKTLRHSIDCLNSTLLQVILTYFQLNHNKAIDIQCWHRIRLDSPSAETNWPIADEPPPLFSTNWTSDTMMLSSRTDPQLMHTALPRAWSTSMSEHPQVLHTRELMMPVGVGYEINLEMGEEWAL